tara:strand:+ start:627 stop:818 length:192 start_codon:yes stop_codon:yes gene_type:complete
MKCFHCKNKIEHEHRMEHLCDGDFVCDKKCKKSFEKERQTFFNNVGNDDWYYKEFPELKQKQK